MVNMQTNRSPLETEPLTKLLFRYSVPTTLTLMVNYIYNIVDQIFVGQGVGITGMAAINIAFPLSILVNAVSLLLGDGCAANVNLCLGRKEQENANKIFGQAVTWIVACGIALAFICGIFAPHIVTLFGTTNTAYGESLAYMRVIAIGIPFQLICPAFTAMIRADGSPQYTMKCMMAGAVVNIILDPVFIFGLKMGVVGAGIATVIGEMAAGILCLLYLRRLQSVQLEKGALRPTWPVLKMILQLGFPSLLTQGLTALVQIVLNNLMRVYGEASIYGSDMALSVYGMMMKVYQLAHSMFVGVSSAIQAQALLDGAREIAVFNKKDAFWEKAVAKAAEYQKAFPSQKITVYDMDDAERLAAEIRTSDILSNATRVGMHPLENISIITDHSLFRKELVVTDVVYEPEKTKLLQDAEAAGCKTVGGLGMLIYQGAAAAKLYTGWDMPVEEVKEKFFQK